MSTPPGPVFVGGSGRSGTTVVGRLIAQSDRYAYVPTEIRFHAEPRGLPGLLAGRVSVEDFVARLRTHWFRRAIAADHPRGHGGRARGLHKVIDEDGFEDAVARFEEGFADDPTGASRRLLEDVLAGVVAAAGKPSFVETTPDNALNAQTLTELFPDCRIVHSVRDGRDVAASIVGRRALDSMHVALHRWGVKMWRTHRWNPDLPRDRVMVLSLYDLASEDREASYARLLDFVGVEDTPPMRAFFEDAVSSDQAHPGRWRQGMSRDEQASIDEHYHAILRRLTRKGVELGGLSPRAPVAAAARDQRG